MRGIVSLIILSAVLPAGCSNVSTPNLVHPGTEEHQQARAYIFEPYPENGPGPPIVGARPREYQDPRPSFAVLQDMHPRGDIGPLAGRTGSHSLHAPNAATSAAGAGRSAADRYRAADDRLIRQEWRSRRAHCRNLSGLGMMDSLVFV